MSKGVIIGIIVGILALITVPVVSVLGMYVSYHDRAVDLESQIVAQYDDLQNTMSNYTLKIQEMVQVTDMYKEDLRDIVEATFTGRYGEDGSKAMFQWIQEQNIQLDASVYKNIQVTIEAGRNEFQNKQTRLLDTKRMYNRELNTVISGLFMRLAGYPKIDLDEYHIIVESGTAQKFETGVDSKVQLR